MRHLVVMPTGTGKTMVMVQTMHHLWRSKPYQKAVLIVVVPNKEIADQDANTFRRVFGDKIKVSEIMGGTEKDFDADVIVITIQSAMNSDNMVELHKQIRGRKVVLMNDEAHHYVHTNSWGHSLFGSLGIFDEEGHYNKNNDIVMIGLTATTDRTDGALLSTVYGFGKNGRPNLRVYRPLSWFIRNGWLVKPRGILVETSIKDLDKIKRADGTYEPSALSRKMRAMQTVKATVDAYLRHALIVGTKKLKKGYIYCVDIEHAKVVAEALQKEITRQGLEGEIASIYCGLDEEEGDRSRDEVMAASKLGKIRALTNVRILTEGVDDPEIEVLVIARPTTSRLLYEQMIGRALRPWDKNNPKDRSKKSVATIVDLTSNIAEHNIDLDRITIHSLFGAEEEPEEVYEWGAEDEEGRPIAVPTSPQPQARTLGDREVELIRLGRSFGPYLAMLIYDHWDRKTEIPGVVAYKAQISVSLLIRYMSGAEIPRRKSQVEELCASLEFGADEKKGLVRLWANDMADKERLEATSGPEGTFSPGASMNRSGILPPELIEMIDAFELDGKIPNAKAFAEQLKSAGFLREAHAVATGGRFEGGLNTAMKNAIREIRKRNLLPARKMLPERAAAVMRADIAVKPIFSQPKWSDYGIPGPREGASLDAQAELAWFVRFLCLAEHGDRWTDASAQSGLDAVTLGRISRGQWRENIPGARLIKIRNALLFWAGTADEKFGTLMMHLFDNFMNHRLGWGMPSGEKEWQKNLQTACRSWLITQFGGLPPENLQHRYQSIVNVASGQIDWAKAKEQPDFRQVLEYISETVKHSALFI